MTDIQQAAEYQAAQHRERKPLDLMLQPFAPGRRWPRRTQCRLEW